MTDSCWLCGQAYKAKVAKLADHALSLAEGTFTLLSRASLPENMSSCLSLVSLLVELLDERAAPLLQPIATTAARVSCCGVLNAGGCFAWLEASKVWPRQPDLHEAGVPPHGAAGQARCSPSAAHGHHCCPGELLWHGTCHQLLCVAPCEQHLGPSAFPA